MRTSLSMGLLHLTISHSSACAGLFFEMCVLMKILSHTGAKKKTKRITGFRLALSLVIFSSHLGSKGVKVDTKQRCEVVGKRKTCKYFHLRASFGGTVNIYYYKRSTFLLQVWAPQGAAILVHSLPMKSRKKVCLWCHWHFSQTFQCCSWCHSQDF